jgi:REP element-mobilizing transposase RayT
VNNSGPKSAALVLALFMSRPWRIEYEGALYHLLSRANERSDIFMNDKDRHSFLDAVGEMSERFDIDIFTYVLMSKHYHLLLRTRQANLKKAMHFAGDQDCHRSYREKVQKYAFEEKRLFEDLRYGLILGSEQFVEKIRKKICNRKAVNYRPDLISLIHYSSFDNHNSFRGRVLICNYRKPINH